jgi:hypothetical protein
MHDRFGIVYNVCSLAQLLKNLGLSSQKAAWVSSPLDEGKRQGGRPTTGPQMLRRAPARQALRLCGDEASCPQGGTLTDTWARRGQPPQVKTSGNRKGYTVFGWMESCTGRFFDPGQEGRLNAPAYLAFRTRVVEQTTPPMMLLQDGANYHTSTETKAFFAQQTARLAVCQLPTSSLDSNPSEKRWKKSKPQDTPLHDCPTFEGLTAQVEQARLKFAKIPEAILALCSLPTA